MMTREPKCVQWKRLGAEKVAAQISGLNLEEELKFWQEQTEQLKLLQAEARKRHKQPAGA
jgi:hypothetical protein